MHHAATLSSTRALAAPAANRSSGQPPCSGSAIASVSSTVATSPARASTAGCQRS
jgi:hypothetical protein